MFPNANKLALLLTGRNQPMNNPTLVSSSNSIGWYFQDRTAYQGHANQEKTEGPAHQKEKPDKHATSTTIYINLLYDNAFEDMARKTKFNQKSLPRFFYVPLKGSQSFPGFIRKKRDKPIPCQYFIKRHALKIIQEYPVERIALLLSTKFKFFNLYKKFNVLIF